MELKSVAEPSRTYTRPDGGFGWLIIFATFLCYVCVSGTAKSNGLFFIYFVDTFGASNSAASSIAFVQKISETVTALIWSILAERYGSRIVVFVGAITLVVGSILSSFATNVLFITITYGAICGMSFSMINYPAVQMLPRYFEKRLVLATALIFCGPPVGSLTVPLIITKSVSAFGLNGTFLILAAVQMHIFIAASLLRPYIAPAEPADCPSERTIFDTAGNSTCADVSVSDFATSSKYENSYSKRSMSSDSATSKATCIIERKDNDDFINQIRVTPAREIPDVTLTTSKSLALPSCFRRKPTLRSSLSESRAEVRIVGSTLVAPSPPVLVSKKSTSLFRSQPSVSSSNLNAVENMAISFAIMDNVSMASHTNIAAIGRQLSVGPSNAFERSHHGLRSFNHHRVGDKVELKNKAASIAGMYVSPSLPSRTSGSSSSHLVIAKPVANDVEAGDRPGQQSRGLFYSLVEKYKNTIRDRLFLMLAFSNFLHSFGMSLWVIFQQAYLKDMGYGDNFRQLFLISASSFTELGSRLSLGFLISRNWIKVYRWNQIACTLMALAMFTYPFTTSYSLMVVYNCFVAAAFSINVVTSMPNLKEFLGIEMAALGQGLMVIPMGLGIVSVQIGGVIRDLTGSFIPGFYMSGASLSLSLVNFQLIGFLAQHPNTPWWMCFFCSEKDSSEEATIKDISQTVLSDNSNVSSSFMSETTDDSIYVPVPQITFTDQVINELLKNQSLQSPSNVTSASPISSTTNTPIPKITVS